MSVPFPLIICLKNYALVLKHKICVISDDMSAYYLGLTLLFFKRLNCRQFVTNSFLTNKVLRKNI